MRESVAGQRGLPQIVVVDDCVRSVGPIIDPLAELVLRLEEPIDGAGHFGQDLTRIVRRLQVPGHGHVSNLCGRVLLSFVPIGRCIGMTLERLRDGFWAGTPKSGLPPPQSRPTGGTPQSRPTGGTSQSCPTGGIPQTYPTGGSHDPNQRRLPCGTRPGLLHMPEGQRWCLSRRAAELSATTTPWNGQVQVGNGRTNSVDTHSEFDSGAVPMCVSCAHACNCDVRVRCKV